MKKLIALLIILFLAFEIQTVYAADPVYYMPGFLQWGTDINSRGLNNWNGTHNYAPHSYIIYIDIDGNTTAVDGVDGSIDSTNIDSSTVFQYVIDNSNGKIFIQKGDYLINTSITFPALGDYIIEGEGNSTRIYNDIALTNGIFNFSPETTWDGRQHQEVKISDILFSSDNTSSSTYGIYAEGRHFLTITECYFVSSDSSNKFTAIYLVKKVNNCIFTNNYFTYCYEAILAPGNDYDDNIISNNVISYTRNIGININDSEKLLITSNTIEETIREGIYLAHITESVISSNIVTESFDDHGISFHHNCTENTIMNNVASANGHNASGKAGIVFGVGSSRNLIIGNRCGNMSVYLSLTPRDIQKEGISFADSTAKNNIVAYNNVYNNNGTNIFDAGTDTEYYGNFGWVTENTGSSTGTGAQQTIAHGLDVTPIDVILWDIETGSLPYQSAAADATNIYITASINDDYGWKAEI